MVGWADYNSPLHKRIILAIYKQEGATELKREKYYLVGLDLVVQHKELSSWVELCTLIIFILIKGEFTVLRHFKWTSYHKIKSTQNDVEFL